MTILEPPRVGAWTLFIARWTDGLVGELNITAVRNDGTEIPLSVLRFPAGWRINAPGVPKAVRTAALKLARDFGAL